MAEAVVRVSLPTNSYTVVITQITGGYRVTFNYTGGGNQYIDLTPCVSIPSVGSPDQIIDHWAVNITYDPGEDPGLPLLRKKPVKQGALKKN